VTNDLSAWLLEQIAGEGQDPAAVEALRRVLEDHAVIHRDVEFFSEDAGKWVDTEKMLVCGYCVPQHSMLIRRREEIQLGYCRIIRQVAAAFAGRPGYRGEWKP
jgi:hypothetical protein